MKRQRKRRSKWRNATKKNDAENKRKNTNYGKNRLIKDVWKRETRKRPGKMLTNIHKFSAIWTRKCWLKNATRLR